MILKQVENKMIKNLNVHLLLVRFLLLYIFLFGSNQVNCLAQQKEYFQQFVDYKIEVTLDDENHILQGKINMKYTNNSPDVLDRIGMHLWPNAFSNNNTAFGKQKLLHRKTEFYDAKTNELGSIYNLHFLVDGDETKLEYLKNQSDQAWLLLNKPLLPGKTINIESPFTVKIPTSFSRLGHVDQTYQITQWYPKPAVYDKKGWHLMPYLDQGEFYSEFGNFEVTIKIPENYVVGATGTLETDSEKEFLNQRILLTNQFIKDGINKFSKIVPSSGTLKTIRYKAQMVHDFAWFADKQFYVQQDQIILESGKKVITWAMFNTLGAWTDAVKFVGRAVAFYSKHVGEYPYPQAIAVHSALSAGAGMEYPMITVIGNERFSKGLDEVITHEVGHNWFYGILASNEREHPFLDEGINSYYEDRYMEEYYPNSSISNLGILSKFTGGFDDNELIYQYMGRSYLDQFPDQQSENFSLINYGTDVYTKSAKLFEDAEEYLGLIDFDRIMKKYYESWKFKHPYPEDLEKIFTENSNKNMDWLFHYFLTTNKKMDYSIRAIKHQNDSVEILLKNSGQVPAPFQIACLQDDQIKYSAWVDGFFGNKKIRIPNLNADHYIIDPNFQSYDLYRHNNTIRAHGIFKKVEPLQVKLFPVVDNPAKTEIGITPVIGRNSYNGFMAGLYFSQPYFPPRDWTFNAMPMYSFGNKSLSGKAHTAWKKHFSEGQIHSIKIGIHAKRFGYDEKQVFNEALNYVQLSPYLEFTFNTPPSKYIQSKLAYQFHYIRDEVSNFNAPDSTFNVVHLNNQIHELKYIYENPKILSPQSFSAMLQFENYNDAFSIKQNYLRADLEFNQKIRIKNKRFFELRLATSFFPLNSQRKSSAIAARNVQNFVRGSAGAAFQGYHDYTNENLFLGRSRDKGIWAQQIMIRQGGMKIAPGISQRSNLGNTNSFLTAINLSTDIPVKYIGNIIRPYFDVVYMDDNSSDKNVWLMSGGINLHVPGDVWNIYFPLYHSSNIRDLYKSLNANSYSQQICFSFQIKFFKLYDILSLI